MRKKSNETLDKYLNEHLPYMLMMVRFTCGQIQRERDFRKRNAFIESFCVNARNCLNFLNNGDTGNTNMKACDFIPGFKANPRECSTIIRKMNEQTFHISENRTDKIVMKFNGGDADKVLKFIDTNIENFLKHLSSDMRAKWNDKVADYNDSLPEPISVSSQNSAACTAFNASSNYNSTSSVTSLQTNFYKFNND